MRISSSGKTFVNLHYFRNHSLGRMVIFAIATMMLSILLPIRSAWAAPRVIPGHVPAAAASLKPIRALEPNRQLHLAIGLPLRNQEALTNLLQQLYDPASPNFHHYLTPDEFTAMFGPTTDDYHAVIDFAQSKRLIVTREYSNRLLLDVSGTAKEIENAFGVTMLEYQHPTESRTFFAPNVEPSVPSTLPVLDISGMSDYYRPHPNSRLKLKNQSISNGGSSPGGSYIGSDFRKAYLPNVTLTGSGQSVALVEFDGYYTSDITSYENQAGIIPPVPLQNVTVDGGVPSPGANNFEVALDIETAIAMAPGLSSIIVYESPATGSFNDVLNQILLDNSAKQISSSWAGFGAGASTEQIFQLFALQGQSFFQASGDADAYTGFSDAPGATIYPNFSPNVTSVGGTTLTTGSGGAWQSETVWNNGNGTGSAGGHASYPIPPWQLGISMTANHGSTTERNFPDVALTADNVYVVYDNGSSGGAQGTSAAAPLWAGVAALVNQQAAASGLPAIGFINPALYSIGKGSTYSSTFHDITTGNNTDSYSPNNYYAMSGYDLCTGWGTPNGQNFINALTQWPIPVALTATPGNGQVVLSWNSVGNVTSYTIQRFAVGTGAYSTIATVPASAGSTYTDTMVANGTAYYYVISATYNDGVETYESANCSPVGPIVPEPIPAAPTVSIQVGNNQAVLTWNSVSGATSYAVQRSTVSGGSYTTIARTSGTGYTDVTAIGGITYYYVISAVDVDVSGPNSTQVSTAPTGSFGWSNTGSLNYGRGNATATLLPNGSVLVAGGDSGSGAINSVELYNSTTGHWSFGSYSMNVAREYATATLLPNGLVLVAGGNNANGAITSAELYNPATGTWTTTGSMGSARQSATATLLPNGSVLVAGGNNGSSTVASAELYNPSTGLWVPTGSMISGRESATATLLPNGLVLVAGGGNANTPLSSAETYNPATGQWSPTPSSMNYAREFATATLLSNGSVLVVGGGSIGQALASAELYNPATGSWTLTGSLNSARQWHTATLLPNGLVLAAGGGASYSSSSLPSTELYNPATGIWTVAGSLTTACELHTATLLPSGAVLVAGGMSLYLSGELPNAELSTAVLSCAPNALVAQPGNNQVLLSWNSVAGATSYTVQRATSPGGSYTTVGTSPGTSYPDNTAINGTAYYYIVSATGGLGTGPSSGAVGPITPEPSLAAPTGLSAQAGNDLVTLTWSSATGATGYNLQRSTINGGPYTTMATVTGTSFSDVTAVGGVVYYYVVSAVNVDVAGPNSAQVGPVTPKPIPGSPTGLTVTPGNNQVTLSWNSLPGITSYSVQRSTSSGGTYTTVGTASSATFTDTSAVNGTAYYYIVAGIAYSPGFYCSPAGPVTPEPTPAAPTGLTATPGNHQIALSWNSVSGATIYYVDRWTAGGGPGYEDTVVGSTTGTSYTDTTTANGTGYYYLIWAVDVDVAGPYSYWVGPITPEPVPATPTGLAAVPGNHQIALSWNTASGATSYSVKRSTSNGGPYSTVATRTVTSYTDTTTANGTAYYYVVSAVNVDVPSPNSSQVGPLKPEPVPGTPTGLSAKPGNNEIVLNWASVTSATSYNVKRSTTSGGPYTTIGTNSGTYYADTTAVNGTAYYYVVSAVNVDVEGLNSSQVGPVTPGAWINTGSVSYALAAQTATLLPNGLVLAAGGLGSSGDLASVSSYNPATGTWTQNYSMNNARAFATATLLPNGLVLVAGGQGGGGYLASAELYNPATGYWTLTGSMSNPRAYATATLLPNGLVLVAGGEGASGTLASAELYNPATGTWTAAGSLNNNRETHTATLLPNGKVLVAGGIGTSGVISSAELYNPATGTWTLTGSLSNGRAFATATLLPNGLVLVVGGFDSSFQGLASAELYNPATGTWTSTGSLNNARNYATATLLPNGLVLVAGGASSYDSVGMASMELDNPANGQWTLTTPMNYGCYWATATLLPNGSVLVAGGVGSTGYTLTSAELYNPVPLTGAGKWSGTGSLNTARINQTTTLLPNGLVLVAGGNDENGGILASAEVYNPANGQFTVDSYSMNHARQYATATLLPNGLVLVAGGDDGTQAIASAELYNPATGQWTATASMSTAREQGTATLLPNGLVLVAGGFDASWNSSTSAELYNPATGTWTTTGSLNYGREWHTATLLPNGLVLVAGGMGAGWQGLSSSELYNPATGTWATSGNLTAVREWHTATLLPNGLVMVAGGEAAYDYSAVATAELYNPATGVWTATGSMSNAREQAMATLLPNGLVLVASGSGSTSPSGNSITSAELYNPATGTWSITGSMFYPANTATLLPNGLVMTVGGYPSAELYSPVIP